MFHGGEVIHEYADAAYSVRPGDKIVSKEVTNETLSKGFWCMSLLGEMLSVP